MRKDGLHSRPRFFTPRESRLPRLQNNSLAVRYDSLKHVLEVSMETALESRDPRAKPLYHVPGFPLNPSTRQARGRGGIRVSDKVIPPEGAGDAVTFPQFRPLTAEIRSP